ARFQRKDVARLDFAKWCFSISLPLRPQEASTVMGAAADVVTERVSVFGIAALGNYAARGGVDFPPFDARFEGLSASGDAANDCVECLDDRGRRHVLSLARNIPATLQIGAVAIIPDAEVDVQHVPWFDRLIRGEPVADHRVGPRVDDGARGRPSHLDTPMF